MLEFLDPIEITVPGPTRPSELKWVGGAPVIVHYGNVPESDITVCDGIRVTTPLRTVIDLAPRVGTAELERMVSDCLQRGLFTVLEAIVRIDQPDMCGQPGALLLRDVLLGSGA